MKTLIAKYAALLDAPITPEAMLELKATRDTLASDKGVVLTKFENPRLHFLDGRVSWADIAPAVDSKVEVNLVVMDKETIPAIKGFKKYVLGYAVDSTKPFEGDNIEALVTTIIPDTDYKVGSILAVKTGGVRPIRADGHFKVEIDPPLTFTAKKDKLNCAKEIIRKAFKAEALEMDKAMAVDLCVSKVLKFDLDAYYGVGVDKAVKFCKAMDFMKEGIVYGIVYPVNEVDTDGDYATPEEVQKAAWRFMEDFQAFNFMHSEPLTAQDVTLVESATAMADIKDLGIKKGDWYIAVRVRNDELKDKILKGEITGFSMEGSAQPGKPIPELERMKQ
ncbi:MAG: XkdF-like putative serine protease domain-containing protein [Patescibacteria group bacterium]|jgi:hypothetical protein